ncbi:MAG: NAD(P)H-binding protein [Candidatus Pacebacteria bacterium]|nr:NAD(P)H-binding protein [Candidatus Paceibacterota bacterium]
MNIAIIGASGFLGRNLISYLLKNTNHQIKALAPDIDTLKVENTYKERVELIRVDAFNKKELEPALEGVDVAFYFIHLLCQKKGFYQKESMVAENIGKALLKAKIRRVIYMSGLGKDEESLSTHLLSRHKTGKILRNYVNQVVEFRASMIIGKGSASFEIVKDIIHKSPVILLPKESTNKTQPIRLEDTLLYLTSAININNRENLILEIGGPEVLSYKEFLIKYRDFIKKKIPIIIISFLPSKIAGLFLNFFTSKRQAIIGQNMIESFKNEMIVTNNQARIIFPDIKTKRIDFSFL